MPPRKFVDGSEVLGLVLRKRRKIHSQSTNSPALVCPATRFFETRISRAKRTANPVRNLRRTRCIWNVFVTL